MTDQSRVWKVLVMLLASMTVGTIVHHEDQQGVVGHAVGATLMGGQAESREVRAHLGAFDRRLGDLHALARGCHGSLHIETLDAREDRPARDAARAAR